MNKEKKERNFVGQRDITVACLILCQSTLLKRWTLHARKKAFSPLAVPKSMSSTVSNSIPEGTATLDSVPREDQTVTYDNKLFTTKREGLAHILIPANARTQLDPKRKGDDNGSDETIAQSVFYNPIQQFNRDLSVLAIRAYGEDLMARRLARLEAKKSRQREKRGMKRKGETLQGTEGDAVDGSSKKLKADTETVANAELTKQQATTVHTEQATDNDIVSADVEVQGTSATQEEPMPEDTPTKPAAKPRFKILDALSATGLRALRYAHEIPFVTQVTANDLSKQATHSISANIKHNKLQDKITTVTSNAMSHMYSFVSHPAEKDHDKKYDVIDLDPYGTAATFLDAAVQAVNDGGLPVSYTHLTLPTKRIV